MKKLLVILLLSICTFCLFTENINVSTYYKDIITIPPDYKNFLSADFNSLTIKEMFYYYSMVSEYSEYFNKLYEWFSILESKIDTGLRKDYDIDHIKSLDLQTKKNAAEKILLLIHENAFKKYNLYANKISDITGKGEFNCVSSSILYGIFLSKYGFNLTGVETSDHVFIEIDFGQEKIDVETTNKYGFDPGKKKDVLDNFGKLTGFRYVPVKDYVNRNLIPFKTIYYLLMHNIANEYYLSNDPLKSVKWGYIIMTGRKDKSGNTDFSSFLINYIQILMDKRDYIKALNITNDFLNNYGMDKTFVILRFNIIQIIEYDWNDFNNYKAMKKLLLDENDRFSELKNDNIFIDTYFAFYKKVVQYFSKLKKFDICFSLIKEFNDTYKNENTGALLSNVIIEFINTNNSSNTSVTETFINLKKDFPSFLKNIVYYERGYQFNRINKILNRKDYKDTINETKMILELYQGDKDFLLLLKEAYIQYSYDYYEKNNFDGMEQTSIEGLSLFPEDQTLSNNLLAFYQNFIDTAIQKKDYKTARSYIDKIDEKYRSNSIFKQADIFLRENKY